MGLPSVEDALVVRLSAASTRFFSRWMESIRDQPGNPSGVEVARFGGAMAVVAPSRADLHWMNQVSGLTPNDAGHVDEILGFYRNRGIAPTLSVLTSSEPEALSKKLVAHGAYPARTMSLLYGAAKAPLPGPGAVEVEAITAAEMDVFSQVWTEGYEIDEAGRLSARTDIEAWPSFDFVRLYLARVDGRPAGAAALAVDDEVGYLANASTIPSLRRHGAHSALLERRIADSAAAGCELVCALAVFGSPSQRNMERLGFRLAGTIVQWRMPDG